MQLEGSLSQKITALKASLIDLISFMELDLDFSEEEIEIIPTSEILKKINDSKRQIEELLKSFNKAKYLSGALEVAIIGKPNAGKSLLLNALLGEDRAIVTNTPGTTRDTIEENLTLKNMLLRISDTAGIRFSKNHVEVRGIQRTWKRVERADVVLWVIDISKNIDGQDGEIFNKLKDYQDTNVIVVGNKVDLKSPKNIKNKTESFSLPVVNISAKTGQGLGRLKEKISDILNEKYKHLGEEIIVTNKRQVESLEKTRNYLVESSKAVESGAGNEFVVIELRNALDALGQITGETASEDILNNIFSGFCIGK